VSFETKAAVHCGTTTITGSIRNISLNGCFLVCDERLPLDSQVSVEVILFGDSSETVVKLSGWVRHCGEDGMTVEFSPEGIELDGFVALKNIIMVNSPSGKTILQEYLKYLRDHDLEPPSRTSE
jgi:hypothetical protein